VQVALVYLQTFRRNSLLKCALQTKKRKIRQNPSIGCSRSFKVIDVNKTKKPLTSACYDKQHLSATVFTLGEPIAAKWRFFIVLLACTVLIGLKGVTDERTNRQTPRRWLRSVKHYMMSRVKSNPIIEGDTWETDQLDNLMVSQYY